MADKKPENLAHTITPEADETPVRPTVGSTSRPKALKSEDPKPRKIGKEGPLEVGVDFDGNREN